MMSNINFPFEVSSGAPERSLSSSESTELLSTSPFFSSPAVSAIGIYLVVAILRTILTDSTKFESSSRSFVFRKERQTEKN